MSDAMSSVEIEDVLSSIRRLVSEDFRPVARQTASVLADDKLILTPALRVVAEQVAATVADVAVRPMPLPRLHLGAEPIVEGLVASLEQAVEAQGLDWESEVGDPGPSTVAFEWTSRGWSALPEDAEAPDAEIVAEEALPEPAQPWAQEDPGEPIADEVVLTDTPDEANFEPDLNWADQAEAEVVAGLSEAEPDPLAGSEMTYDEAVLRDLVRDLIREELQGGLGERITRNVRKLVRAEIGRALATREFD